MHSLCMSPAPEKYLADRRRGHYWASWEKKRQRGLQFPKWKKYYADGARLRNKKHRVNKEVSFAEFGLTMRNERIMYRKCKLFAW